MQDNMTLEKLKEKRSNIESQMQQVQALFSQCQGALAVVNEFIKELEGDSNDDRVQVDETGGV